MTLQPDPTRTPEPERPSLTGQELDPQSLIEMAAWIDGGGDPTTFPAAVGTDDARAGDWKQAAADVGAVVLLSDREPAVTVPERAGERIMLLIERQAAVKGSVPGHRSRRPSVLARIGRPLTAAAAIAFAAWAGFDLGVTGTPAGAPQNGDPGVASSLFDVTGWNGVWSDIGDDPFVLMIAQDGDQGGGVR